MPKYTFLDFLHKKISFNHPAIIFQGNTSYPLLFFFLLSEKLKSEHALQKLDVSLHDENYIKTMLSTSFLDARCLYIFSSVDQLNAKTASKLYSFIGGYKGPHHIISWAPIDQKVEGDSISKIEMPTAINQEIFVALARYFDKKIALHNRKFASTIFKKNAQIPLEIACLLLFYANVLSSDIEAFAQIWLDRIIDAPHTLFTLSSLFFAKKKQEFMNLWFIMRDEYQFPFWLTFWSEQLFRAAQVVSYQQAKNTTAAKKIGNRLPFAFLSSGWQATSINELTNAHNYIYQLDYACKNGGSFEMIELFYSKFFAQEFAK